MVKERENDSFKVELTKTIRAYNREIISESFINVYSMAVFFVLPKEREIVE